MTTCTLGYGPSSRITQLLDGLPQMSTRIRGHLGTETPPRNHHNCSLSHVISSQVGLYQACRFWVPCGDTGDIWSNASDHTKMASHILILIVVLWMVVSIPSGNIQTCCEYHDTLNFILLIQNLLSIYALVPSLHLTHGPSTD